MNINEALEFLSRSDLKSTNQSHQEKKIESLQLIERTFFTVVQDDSFNQSLSFAIFALLRMLQDQDMNIWSLAEQILIKIIKLLYTSHHGLILKEIWKGVAGTSIELRNDSGSFTMVRHEGKGRRFSIEVFSHYASMMNPQSTGFMSNLIKALLDIFSSQDQLLHETLSNNIGPMVKYHLYHGSIANLKPLILQLVNNLKGNQHKTRVASINSLISICQELKNQSQVIALIFYYLFSQNDVDEDDIDDDMIFQGIRFDIDLIPKADLLVTLQGILTCCIQFLRYTSANEVSIETMMQYIPTILSLSIYAIKNPGNQNVLVGGLEALEILLLNFNSSPSMNQDTLIHEVLEMLGNIIFSEDEKSITAKIQALTCLCAIPLVSVSKIETFTKNNFDKIMHLRSHYDPLLRCKVIEFLGTFLNHWIKTPNKIETDINIYPILFFILESVFKDDSSIVSKNCCKTFIKLTPNLLNSEYYAFVPIMIKYLLQFEGVTHKIVKGKIISLLCSIDYSVVDYIEKLNEEYRHSENLPHIKTCQPISLQDQVLNLIISSLGDSDLKIRNKTSKSLVFLIPKLYQGTIKTDTPFNSILNLQTSIHKSGYFNNGWKGPISIIMSKIYPLIHIYASENMMKGIYKFLRRALESGYRIPPEYIPIFIQQIESCTTPLDLDTQLDLLVLLSHSSPHIQSDRIIFVKSLFYHTKNIMCILWSILRKRYHVFLQTDNSDPIIEIGSFMAHPYYQQIREKLEDAFRLSLSTFQNTIFDDYCRHTINAIERIVPYLGSISKPMWIDLFVFFQEFFFLYTEEVIHCLDELLFCVNEGIYPPSGSSNELLHSTSSLEVKDLNVLISTFNDKTVMNLCLNDKTLSDSYHKKNEIYTTLERIGPFQPLLK